MTGVFAYLTACSIRNAVRVRVRQLRQPRYLLIAVGFVLYVGSMMMGRPRSGTFGLIAMNSPRAWLIAAAVTTVLLGTAWILPAGTALGFSGAEIQFLFPAPIARRTLIGYKVGRLLLGGAASGAFFTIFVGPPRLGPALLFAAKSAIVVSILNLHGAGVAMYRSRASDEGRPGARRWQVLAIAGVLLPVIAAGLVFIAFASGAQIALAVPLAAALLGANAAWIVQSDSAFEEAATEAADRRSRAGAMRPFAPRVSRKRSTPFRLSARGPAETAILWKNWLLIGRTSRRTLVGVSAIVIGSALTGIVAGSGGVFGAEVIGDVSVFAVALVVLLGPAMIRVDLRQDLGHLALIKTWPVSGPAVIRGELLAPAIALSLCAGAAIVLGSAFAPGLFLVDRVNAGTRVVFAMSAVLAVTAVIVAELVVHNGIAASFPAWVEVKAASGAAAMEMNVRMMIVMYGALLVLAFVLVIPVLAGVIAYFVAGGLLLPSAIFAALLFGESLAATEIIGRILDRTDLHDVAVTD